MYYNPDIPLETALEMFDDPSTRYEIIEDYYAASLLEKLGSIGLEAVGEDEHE